MDFIRELGLNKYQESAGSGEYVTAIWLIDRLLELISRNASDGDKSRESVFRSELKRPQQALQKAGASRVPCSTANTALDLCQEQFETSRVLRFERDENISEVILFLRNALVRLGGDSRQYHENLTDTAERIGRLSDLKDIQELKSRVAEEVKELNRIVKEKQEREQSQFEELSSQVTQLQTKLEKAKTEATVDSLTGVANRRRFDSMIRRWVLEHQESEQIFTVAIVDLDDFKKINDTHGHQAGDQVLASVADELGRQIRSCDFLARYGGEEFVILSKGMNLVLSEDRYSEVLERIARKPVRCLDSLEERLDVSITASCGVAEYARGESVEDLIKRADEALYEAKRLGKNRVVTKRRSGSGPS